MSSSRMRSVFLELLRQFNTALHMDGMPHLHGPLANVEKLADFLVPPFPILLLTDLGAGVHGGSACTAAKDRDSLGCNDVAGATGLGHD
jgi:hypothetical protein